jgi:hypothetical protein
MLAGCRVRRGAEPAVQIPVRQLATDRGNSASGSRSAGRIPQGEVPRVEEMELQVCEISFRDERLLGKI